MHANADTWPNRHLIYDRINDLKGQMLEISPNQYDSVDLTFKLCVNMEHVQIIELLRK